MTSTHKNQDRLLHCFIVCLLIQRVYIPLYIPRRHTQSMRSRGITIPL
jgi:hypothetical protein